VRLLITVIDIEQSAPTFNSFKLLRFLPPAESDAAIARSNFAPKSLALMSAANRQSTKPCGVLFPRRGHAEVAMYVAFPQPLTAFLGLVPSQRTTGDTVRRGCITKTGNHRAPRVRVTRIDRCLSRRSHWPERRQNPPGNADVAKPSVFRGGTNGYTQRRPADEEAMVGVECSVSTRHYSQNS
jgi:Transposase IS116/IS110/IS902 family